jgi:hypothetical protein
MITKIPEGQICQAFDPKMNLHTSILKSQRVSENANTSCLAPAYVYIEGTHGKKFLCDYHYHYEVYMTSQGYSDPSSSWKDIQKFIIDERERVKETFAKNVTTTETVGQKCSLVNSYNITTGCVADAFVKVNPIKLVVGKINFTAIKDLSNISNSIFYCNFHFRREYFRYYNNGVVYEDFHNVLDERYRMNITIAEEATNLKYV